MVEPRGVFVVFEGGDGAGKSTQIDLARDWLEDEERPVVVTREPGGTALGQQIRELLLHGEQVSPRAEALLFAADRAHHMDTLVRPALNRGEVVLQDRFIDSSVAYQGAGRALRPEEVESISRWATGGMLPDVTVLLDVAPEEGRRRRGIVQDRLEQEGDDFHERVRERYLGLAQADPARYLVVDAALPAEEIAAIVRSRLADLVGVRA